MPDVVMLPGGLDGALRRTAPGSKLQIDHKHDWLEINLVVRGMGSYLVKGDVCELNAGTVVWLLPGQQHRLTRSLRLEMWMISARPEIVPPHCLTSVTAQTTRAIAGEELMDLDRLLSQVSQDSDDPDVYNAGIRYVITRLWRAWSDSSAVQAKPMHPAVSRALLLFRERGGTLALSELAEAAGIAAPYLSRLLVEHTGRSFLEWRNRIRLDRFMQVYKPGANLLTVSLDAGFGSYSRFHHVFAQIVGCPPGEWAKREEARLTSGIHFADVVGQDSHGTLETIVISNRMRWTQFVPLASPVIADLLGQNFIERIVSQSAETRLQDAGAIDRLDANFTESERNTFVAGLASNEPKLAAGVSDLIGRHNLAGSFSALLTEFGLSPSRLADSVAAMIAVLWTSIHTASDPSADTVQALARQVSSALYHFLPRANPGRAQSAHTALLCHFVIVHSALEATRARGDTRAAVAHAENTAVCAKAIFGSDMGGLDLAAGGLIWAA